MYVASTNEIPNQHGMTEYQAAYAAYRNADKFMQDDYQPIHHSISEAKIQNTVDEFKQALDGNGGHVQPNSYSHSSSVSFERPNIQQQSHEIVKPKPMRIRKNQTGISKLTKKPTKYASAKLGNTKNVMENYKLDKETASNVVLHELRRRKNERSGLQTKPFLIDGKPFDTSRPDIVPYRFETRKQKVKKIP